MQSEYSKHVTQHYAREVQRTKMTKTQQKFHEKEKENLALKHALEYDDFRRQSERSLSAFEHELDASGAMHTRMKLKKGGLSPLAASHIVGMIF
jgi:hypothetical protein